MDPTQGYGDQAPSTRSNYIAAAGEGAGGLVRIELDGDGRLWDVVLDPRITELPADELRTALFDAVTAAQDGVPAPPDAGSFADAVADVNTTAERRFAEISGSLHDLLRRAVRR